MRVIIRQGSISGGRVRQRQRLDHEMMKGVVFRREDRSQNREVRGHADETGDDRENRQNYQWQRHRKADDPLPQVGVFSRLRAGFATKSQRNLPHGIEGGHEGRQCQQDKDERMGAAAVLFNAQPGIRQNLVF